MKRAVIFLNGNRPPRNLVFETIKTTDTIICADGGARHVIAAGFTPHTILGDLDSLPKTVQRRLRRLPIRWETFPRDKDFTDSELALRHAVEEGFRDIIIFGVLGDRADHMHANINLFARIVREKKNLSLRVAEEKQTLYFVSKRVSFMGEKGQTVSLIPLHNDTKGITTTGLKWRLQNAQLSFGESRGVSNEIIGRTVTVFVDEGILLLVHQKGKV